MSNYTMPRYFQNMQVLNVPAAKPNPENVKELKEVEQDIHARAEKLLSAGTPDDKIHAKGQYTALERINQRSTRSTTRRITQRRRSALSRPALSRALVASTASGL